MKSIIKTPLIGLLLATLLFGACSKKTDSPANDTAASFTTDKEMCKAPCTVTMSNQSTGTGALTYFWDFGDDNAKATGAPNTSTAKNPSHAYLTPGDCTIKLTVAGQNGINYSSRVVSMN